MFNQTQEQDQGNNLDNETHTEVRIDALGRVTVEGKNYEGDACSLLGDRIKSVLGGKGDKTDKPEAFAGSHATEEQSTHW